MTQTIFISKGMESNLKEFGIEFSAKDLSEFISKIPDILPEVSIEKMHPLTRTFHRMQEQEMNKIKELEEQKIKELIMVLQNN